MAEDKFPTSNPEQETVDIATEIIAQKLDEPMRFPKLDRLNMILRRFEQFIMLTGIAIMALLLMSQAVTRYGFNFSFHWSEEVGTFFVILTGYIGASYAARQGKHIRMNILSEKLKFKSAKMLTFCTDVVAIIGFGMIAVYTAIYGYDVFESGRMWQSLAVGKWLLWVPVVVGMAATCVQYMITFYKNVRDKDHLWTGSERRLGDPSRLLY